MDQPNPNFTGDYDTLLELVKSRASVRKLKPDPIPDEHVTQILEVGRWAMSGANGQPWDFIVVKDPAIKKELFRAYIDENNDFIYWMEQQRDFSGRRRNRPRRSGRIADTRPTGASSAWSARPGSTPCRRPAGSSR